MRSRPCGVPSGGALGRKRRQGTFALILLAASCAGLVVGCRGAGGTSEQRTAFVHSDYADLTSRISEDRIREHIRYLAGLGSRVSGSIGCEWAAEYVEDQFRTAGLVDIERQDFDVEVPVDEGSSLTLDSGQKITVHAVWPNFIRTSQVAPGEVRGPIIYARDCSLSQFNGKDVKGAIVLADFNCGTAWLNVPLLGGRAVVFVEPDDTTWSDAAEKYLKVPVDIPRFYLERKPAEQIIRRVESSRQPVTGSVECRMTWQTKTARNIIARIPGQDPEFLGEHIFLEAYYDSTSVVPNMAPGADQASSIAGLIELARVLSAAGPARTVVFAATSAHFIGLKGAMRLGDVLGPKGRRPREQDQFLRDGVRDLTGDIERWERSIQEAEQSRDFAQREMGEGTYAPTTRGEIDWDDSIALTRHRIELARQDIALIRRYRDRQQTPSIPLWLSIDLSSRSRLVGLNYCGHYFNRSDLIRFFSPLGKRLALYLEDIAPALGYENVESFWFDGTNPKQNVNWPDHFPGRIAFDSEMPLQAGRPACVLATGQDLRPYFDTPLDLPSRVDYESLRFQTQVLACVLSDFLNDPNLVYTAFKRTHRLKLPYQLEPLRGDVLEFVEKKSFLPNTPVPGALALIQGPFKSMMGVHSDIIDRADGSGSFKLQGFINWGWQSVDSYYLNPTSGRIDYAPDLGSEGEKRYARNVSKRGRQIRPVIIFPCKPIDLYDLIDQRYLETLEQMFVYNARTDSEPIHFGYALPQFNPPAGEMGVAVEPVATVFCNPLESVKIAMAMGIFRARLVLLNSTEQQPLGAGFDPNLVSSVPATLHQAARDMWIVDDMRLRDFAKRGVEDPRLNSLHGAAESELASAATAGEEKRWDDMLAHSRAAWAYESNAYPDVLKTARDVVAGALFYLALLMSFAYFCERLIVAATSVHGRVIWTTAIFLVIFAALMNVHPAFSLSINPYIILLAFIVLALAIIVTVIVTTKFNEQLEKLKQEVGGIHKADVGRMSAATMAFTLGVANMRRRRLRSGLTCVTLVLLTFTVLSFTSVSSGTKINRIHMRYAPQYYGFLIRDKVWSALEDSVPDVMRNEFGHLFHVAPRGWLVSGDIAKKAYYSLFAAGDPLKEYQVNAMLGLSPEERYVTHLEESLLPGGRWFSEKDGSVVILPAQVAEALGVTEQAVAQWNTAPPPRAPGESDPSYYGLGPFIRFSGAYYQVVGVIKDEAIDQFVDLDGETIAPVNYADLKPEVLAQIREMSQQRYKLGRTGVESLLQEYKHFSAREMVIVPYQRLLRIGGATRAIVIDMARTKDDALAAQTFGAQGVPVSLPLDEAARYAIEQKLVTEFMDRFAISMYAGETAHDGEPPRVTLYSSIGRQSLDGLETVLIPILIAALIVLNTMLGAVYERISEIHVFSAVGLNPTHIGTLFLAEACVYANIGAIIGYLIGQTLAKVLFVTGHVASSGISLNYSSKSAVMSTLVVVATVLLSTLWPARKAAEISVPDIDRKWKLPEPEGDDLVLPMPFTVTGLNSKAANMFLLEFFQAYVGYAGGDFYTEGVDLAAFESEHGEAYRIQLLMWLAPYDLGVSQTAEILTTPTGEMNVYSIALNIHREAGDISSWKKTNWLFLNVFRKQLLIWRTLTPEQREVYAGRAGEHLARQRAGQAAPAQV